MVSIFMPKATAAMTVKEDFRRRLNAFDAAMIVSGAIIGAGIFLNPAESAKFLQSSSQLLLVWALGGFIAFLGALCFSELGTMFPESGGQVVYLEKAFSSWVGFLFGWTLFSTIQTGALAAVAFTCARFCSTFIPMGDFKVSLLAAAFIWVLSLINFFGIKPGSIVQNIFSCLKIGALAVIIVIGILHLKTTPLHLGPLFPEGLNFKVLNLMGLALMPVLFSYGGWQNLNFVAGEVKRPERNMPIAILTGVCIVIFVYVSSNMVFAGALSLPEIGGSTKLASDAMQVMIGPFGAKFVAIAIILSTFGFTNVVIMTGPRVYYVMARNKMFLPLAGRLHPRYRTPHYSIFMQSIWATVLLFSNTYGQLLQYVTFGDWIFFGMTALGLIVLRKKLPDTSRPYRTWGYPWVPLVFSAVAFAAVINVFFSSFLKSLIGLLIILSGLPIYYWMRKKEDKHGV